MADKAASEEASQELGSYKKSTLKSASGVEYYIKSMVNYERYLFRSASMDGQWIVADQLDGNSSHTKLISKYGFYDPISTKLRWGTYMDAEGNAKQDETIRAVKEVHGE